MRSIRKDLIEQELQKGCTKDVDFKCFVFTKRFVRWLLSKYQVVKYSVHYYDSEPDVPPERDCGGAEWDDPEFEQVWRSLVKDYEPRRILFCNWIDEFSEGLCDRSQEEMDVAAIECLDELIETVTDVEDRFYVGFGCDGRAYLYFYGRDNFKYDYWFCLKIKQFAHNGL